MNKWLVGNGVWCPACKGTGRGTISDTLEYESGMQCNFYYPCPSCKGEKRIAAEVADVIAHHVPHREPESHSILSRLIEYVSPDGLEI